MSNEVARILREWIPSVLQTVDVWVSTEDIGKGKRWSEEISKQLENCRFGIVCVTGDNAESPWVNFEAGALAKSVPGSLEEGRVTPLLLGVEPSDLNGPLAHFQATTFQRDDVLRLVSDINAVCEAPLDGARLRDAFEVWWPRLEEKLASILIPSEPGAQSLTVSGDKEILGEILASVRSQERSLLRLERVMRPDTSPYAVPDDDVASDIFSRLRELGLHPSSMGVDGRRWEAHLDGLPGPEEADDLHRWARRQGIVLVLNAGNRSATLGI